MKSRSAATDSLWVAKRQNEYEDGRSINKFGVPHHRYSLTLEDGTIQPMDVGYEEDWGHVQECALDDPHRWVGVVGWGNDIDGHKRIVAVKDDETGEFLNVRHWAKNDVWVYVNCYSEAGCAKCLSLDRVRPTKLNECPYVKDYAKSHR